MTATLPSASVSLDRYPEVKIERLFDGQPLLSPTDMWWESGVTFNTAALLLVPGTKDDVALKALLPDTHDQYPDGVVALHYRARPKTDPGFRWTRSFIGLALFTPELELIKRWNEPLLSPGDHEDDPDYYGVEDPRITYIEGAWYLVYCGVQPLKSADPERSWLGTVCVAKSHDLLNWEKLGAVVGDSDAFPHEEGEENIVSNKDGVLFPDRIDGKIWLLHRPMSGDLSDYSTDIAAADEPGGPYHDYGYVHGAMRYDEYVDSWVGAGTVPIKVGEGRYIAIGHTGNYLPGLKRKYVLDAFLFDFNCFDGKDASTLVAARMDDIMRPETPCEIHGPFPDSVANVVFACGSYVRDGWLYILYGGGDSFIMAARTRFDALVSALEEREKP